MTEPTELTLLEHELAEVRAALRSPKLRLLDARRLYRRLGELLALVDAPAVPE